MRPTPKKADIASAFVGVGCIAFHEEKLVLLKPVVQFSFAYGVSRRRIFLRIFTVMTVRREKQTGSQKYGETDSRKS